MLLLLVANVINLGADLGAMGAALGLLIGGPVQLYAVVFGVVCVLLETFMSYARYAAVLKWATLSLFAYVAVVFAAHVPWGTALASTLVPHLVFDKPHAMAMVAVLGTTISPYLFFWQAGQEVEELRRRHVKALCITPREAGPELSRIRTDTIVGMGISNLIALCIIFATAATLNANGVTDIQTSVAGGGGAAADRGRVHLRAVRGRHHRNRHAGGAGARRLRRLRGERGVRLDGRARPPPERGQSVLRHDRGRDARRGGAQLHVDRSRSRRCTGAPSSTACWQRR